MAFKITLMKTALLGLLSLGHCWIWMLFCTYIYLTGEFTPITVQAIDLQENPWSSDSKTLRFRAVFPIEVKYQLTLDTQELKAISGAQYASIYQPNGGEFIHPSQQDRLEKLLGDYFGHAKWSPNSAFLAVVMYDRKATLYILDAKHNILYQADRRALLKQGQFGWGKYSVSFPTVKRVLLISVIISSALVFLTFRIRKNYVLWLLLVPMPVIVYVCTIFVYSFSWLPPG
jgi:hypothetical protein